MNGFTFTIVEDGPLSPKAKENLRKWENIRIRTNGLMIEDGFLWVLAYGNLYKIKVEEEIEVVDV